MQNRVIRIFALLLAVIALSSCGEESETKVGIWEKGGVKPYSYALSSYVVLGDYVGIMANPVILPGYDEDTAIKARMSASVTYSDTEEITNGTKLTVKVKSYLGTNECDFANCDSFSFTVGAFESFPITDKYVAKLLCKAIENAALSENFQSEIQCPSYYSEKEYAGKSIQLTVEVLSKKKAEFPEIKGENEAVTAAKAKLEDEMKECADYAQRQILWLEVAEDATVFTPLPKNEVERCKKEYIDYYKELASRNNCTYSAYIDSLGMKEKDVIEKANEYADKKVRYELVAFAIAQDEGLIYDKKTEFEEDAYKMAAEFGYSGYDELIKYNSEESIYIYLTWKKAADFIVNHAEFPKLV